MCVHLAPVLMAAVFLGVAPQEKCQVTVCVKWEDYGTRIRKARVEVSGLQGTTEVATTDAHGLCRFEDLSPGVYRVSVTKANWKQLDYTSLRLKPGQKENVVALLRPTLLASFVHLLKVGALFYVFVFGLMILCLNYFITPEPRASLAGLGLATVAASVLICAARMPALVWVPFAAVEVAATGALIHYGRRSARKRAQRSVSLALTTEPDAEEQLAWKRLELEGKVGTAATALRPTGLAEFGLGPIDVVARSGYVAPGTRVRVESVFTSKVIVTPLNN